MLSLHFLFILEYLCTAFKGHPSGQVQKVMLSNGEKHPLLVGGFRPWHVEREVRTWFPFPLISLAGPCFGACGHLYTINDTCRTSRVIWVESLHGTDWETKVHMRENHKSLKSLKLLYRSGSSCKHLWSAQEAWHRDPQNR